MVKELLKFINRDSYSYTCLLGLNPDPSFYYLIHAEQCTNPGPIEICK